MKELLIAFIIALVVGSYLNGISVSTQQSNAAAIAAANLPSVDESNFDSEVLNATTPVLVDFYTDSCPHCRNMVPVLNQLATEYQGSLKLVRIDADSNPKLAERYRVQGVPAFFLFKNGGIVEEFAGERDKSELDELIKKHIAVAEPQSRLTEG